MATSPVFPKTNQTWLTETLRRGVSFVLARARPSTATLFRVGVMGCTLLTFGLGFLLWDRFPFREDEAIYAYWALHFARIDPWFLTVWPDKPPLFLWSLAGIFELFGPSPASARFLNMAITALTVPVVAMIARHLWGRSAGLWAAATFALNPFVLSFAPTAFTDPMLVLWGMVALYAALTRRPFWAGIALGAAIMTKQQGVLFVPLVLGAAFNAQCTIHNAQCSMFNGARTTHHVTRSTLLGLALIILPVVLWDSRRWAVAPSPWDLAARNYGGLGLLAADQWGERWREWGDLIWYLGGSWWVWAGIVLAAGVVTAQGKSRQTTTRIPNPGSPIPNPHILLPLWTAGFIAFHLFTTVQPWDRYLLPLAAMVALWAGWVGWRIVQRFGRQTGAFLGLAWILLLLPPGMSAAQGGMPVGGDHGDYAGLDAAFSWVQSHAPADAVLYHQDLGWQHQFYLFGQTQETRADGNGFDLRWTPSAIYLADNAAKTPHRAKFLIQPAWASTRSQARYLPMRGVAWLPRFQAHNFTVYEIVTPPGQPCDWCACAPSPFVVWEETP